MNPEDIINEFEEIFFLIEPDTDEKDLLHTRMNQHLKNVNKKKTIDRMGLAISDSCNLGCEHCMHFQKSNENGKPHPFFQTAN